MMNQRSLRLPTVPALLALAGLPVLGCGAATHSPLADPELERPLTVQTDEWRADVRLRRSGDVTISEMPATLDEAWRSLKAAWVGVGLPPPVVDDQRHTLTLSDHPIARRLGERPLSTYLSCGRGIQGPNADTHRVILTVRSALEAVSPDTTRLHSRVDAVAVPMTGGSTSPSECASTGNLESLIAFQAHYRLAESLLR